MVALTFRLAVLLPTVPGAKVTLIVHVANGARVAPQVVVSEYAPGLLSPRGGTVAETVGAVSRRFAVPVLDTVTSSVLLAALATFPNASAAAGATVRTGTRPVPVSDTVCGVVLVAFTFSVAAWMPPAFGAKLTLIVQEAPGATLAPQLVVVIVIVYRALPVIVGAPSSRFPAPLLVTVTGSTLLAPAITPPNASGLGVTVMATALPVPDSNTVWEAVLVAFTFN